MTRRESDGLSASCARVSVGGSARGRCDSRDQRNTGSLGLQEKAFGVSAGRIRIELRPAEVGETQDQTNKANVSALTTRMPKVAARHRYLSATSVGNKGGHVAQDLRRAVVDPAFGSRRIEARDLCLAGSKPQAHPLLRPGQKGAIERAEFTTHARIARVTALSSRAGKAILPGHI